jgi:hypothetical protein
MVQAIRRLNLSSGMCERRGLPGRAALERAEMKRLMKRLKEKRNGAS